MNPTLKYGLILGVISITIQTIIYVVDPYYLISWWNLAISMILMLVFMALGCIYERKRKGGFISFGGALLSAWLISMIYLVVSVVWQHLMYTVIDPSLYDLQMNQVLSYFGAIIESFGGPEADAMMDELNSTLPENTPMTSLSNSISGLVCYGNFTLLPAVIYGFIFKRENKNLFT